MDIELHRLRKSYGATTAVADLSATVPHGTMLALLGPSGCGKTTTLRMVAGFIAPTSGSIRLGGRDITALPAHKRDAGLVFQSYALFPHLTAAENVAFGLRRRGVARAEREQRVAAMLDKLKLSGLADRYPRQLSGGQQQRVAVARALVINPAILLLDEPFSNLDAKLRESTGLEMARLQREFGLTSIFVTHDQSEAMSIADTVAVMNEGVIQQIGPAREIYERPANRFVADFIGRANFLRGSVKAFAAETVTIALDAGPTVTLNYRPAATPGETGEVLVRPEALGLVEPGAPGALAAIADTVTYQGSATFLRARLVSGELVVVSLPAAVGTIRAGSSIALTLNAGTMTWLTATDAVRLGRGPAGQPDG
jgi:putative spermidine/putrescine transport system ATP-binding protein